MVFLLTFDTKAAPELKNDPSLRRRLTRHQSLQEVAASGKGQLIVELQGGRDLASKGIAHSLSPDKNGLSDPYCIINFAGQVHLSLTAVPPQRHHLQDPEPRVVPRVLLRSCPTGQRGLG